MQGKWYHKSRTYYNSITEDYSGCNIEGTKLPLITPTHSSTFSPTPAPTTFTPTPAPTTFAPMPPPTHVLTPGGPTFPPSSATSIAPSPITSLQPSPSTTSNGKGSTLHFKLLWNEKRLQEAVLGLQSEQLYQDVLLKEYLKYAQKSATLTLCVLTLMFVWSLFRVIRRLQEAVLLLLKEQQYKDALLKEYLTHVVPHVECVDIWSEDKIPF